MMNFSKHIYQDEFVLTSLKKVASKEVKS